MASLFSDDAKPDAAPVDFTWMDFDQTQTLVGGGQFDLRTKIVRSLPLTTEHAKELLGLADDAIFNPGSTALSPQHGQLIWSLAQPSTNGGSNISVFAVRRDAFVDYIRTRNHAARLTKAEAVALLQIVGGASWRDAAAVDGVTVETKRKQFKSASAKLGVSGQIETVIRVLSQLSMLNSHRMHAMQDHQTLQEFWAKFLARETRLSIIPANSGRHLRFFEAGPATGRPVLVFHGTAFPIILLDKAEILHELGIRVIAPLRRGYFENANYNIDVNSLDTALQDAATVLDMAGLEKVDVLGSGFGVAYASYFAANYSNYANKLICLSPFIPVQDNSQPNALADLINALGKIGSDTEQIKELIGQYIDHKSNPHSLIKLFDGLLASTEIDREYLREPVSNSFKIYELLAEVYRVSMFGIVQDFQYDVQNYTSVFQKIECPIALIRGAEDEICTKAICQLLRHLNPAATYMEIEEGGQFTESTQKSRSSTWEAMFAR
ncbi:MAG: alpha/beta hydrolase [Pseudomonadota bacterium]